MKILIIGGSGGIGSALTALLRADGHEVDVTYRRNRAAAESLSQTCGARPVALDLADKASVESMDQRIRTEAYQGLVMLAAEPVRRELFIKSDPARIERYVLDGLRGALRLTQAFAAAVRTGSGVNLSGAPNASNASNRSIVYVLSSYILGLPPEQLTAYVTLKHALWGLAKSQAVEFRRYGIRVNSVSPAMTRTGYISDLPERFVETHAEALPMGRIAEPGEPAAAIRFLLSPEASYITGVNLPVAGGQAC